MQVAVETAAKRDSMTADFATQLDHLVRMVTEFNQREYAWSRAKELDRLAGYEGMAAALTERMKQQEKTT